MRNINLDYAKGDEPIIRPTKPPKPPKNEDA